MKTLYLSDLDGTLLRDDETVSSFTAKTINTLLSKGVNFSFATARSAVTALKVTADISNSLPMIIYNGTFTIDTSSKKMLLSNFFGEKVYELLEDLKIQDIYPVVYSFKEETERLSFVKGKSTIGQQAYLNSRKGDKRINPVDNFSRLTDGKIFYITCIDQKEKLLPILEKYQSTFRCLYQKDYYAEDYWLEIMPKGISKANAAIKLKELLGCEKLVVFGDEINDIDLFKAADEAYAVENAVDELKALATGIIKSNNEDGVACWLNKNI